MLITKNSLIFIILVAANIVIISDIIIVSENC